MSETKKFEYPELVLNQVGLEDQPSVSNRTFDNLNPHNGKVICRVTDSTAEDVDKAVQVAKKAQKEWASVPPVKRGQILFDIAHRMEAAKEQIAEIVALEGGKPYKDALGETGAAIAQAYFMAGEGQRLFGRTTVSGVPNKYPVMVREPMGVCSLIVASNTPIANVAWKVFPALIAGNAAILKASEDTPLTAWIFGKILAESELTKGALTILQGRAECGAAMTEHKEIPLVSFTGSSEVGKKIAQTAGSRLAKTFMELGGKNPLVVCDDADIENALKWVLASSFSNAGQRCAASSRIIIDDAIYDDFKAKLVEQTNKLTAGIEESDFLGPVINERSLERLLSAVEIARKEGATVLTGGKRLDDEAHKDGFYLAPTIIEGVSPESEVSQTEWFGPLTCLYRARDFNHAVELANNTRYGLTAAIHTKNYHRAFEFMRRVESGVVTVNAGTHGSEPHLPFGGRKESGTGGREPGTEALDVYTNLKVLAHNVDPTLV